MCPLPLGCRMKLALALTIALTLAAPLTSADQSVQQGPVSAYTQSSDVGDECGGDNSYHYRTAEARVTLFPGETVGASFAHWCVDQSGPGWYNHGGGLYATVDHRVDNNAGPQAYAGYSDNDMNGWHMCGLWIGAVGLPTQWGCLPAGTQIPLLPPLP